MAEILCNEVRKYEDRALPKLALQTFDHPFPYGLNLPEQDVVKVTKMCANVKVLNLVSLDNTLIFYSNFQHLTKATIEMEDAFGMGLYNFLRISGPNLKEITISCGSDADSTFLGNIIMYAISQVITNFSCENNFGKLEGLAKLVFSHIYEK